VTVRTRFAPSPTGYIHVGGIRTAVFAWLLAKQNNGQFILRLEDTDKKREVEGTDQHIIDSLNALGLTYDEGPDKGGPYGPYRQSERLSIYHEWAERLIKSGRAYADPYTPEEIESFRAEARTKKRPFLYRNHRPANPPTWEKGKPLRFKSEPKPYSWTDAVMGKLQTGESVIDDFVLIKSDGYPTYNFAHIVDDHLMQISHVIRGQEFLASVPNYLNLYDALEIKPPILATVPHILAPDGKKKLSKRDGAKDVTDYLKDGYLPDALLNFIATLGWNDGTEQEIFTRSELIDKFSLERVQKSGAHFDERRLIWLNGSYIRTTDIDNLMDLARLYWPSEAAGFDDAYKTRVLGLIQERLKYLGEIPELIRFFFLDLPLNPELITGTKTLTSFQPGQLKSLLQTARDALGEIEFNEGALTQCLNDLLIKTSQKPAVLFSLIRIATTQAPSSPGLAETLEVLGKDRSLKRIDAQINALA